MRAGEEYSELVDLGNTYVSGRYGNSTSGWNNTATTTSGGGGGGGGSSRTPGGGGGAVAGRSGSRMPAEAEDALGPSNNSPRAHSRTRSGLYYSPPGTSYTIVERPSSGMHHHSSREYRDYYNTTSPRGAKIFNFFASRTLNLILIHSF